MPDNNSKSVPWKWLAGILTLVVVGLLAAWGNDITSRTTVAQAAQSANSARISVLEANMQAILLRLERIENKIDAQGEKR